MAINRALINSILREIAVDLSGFDASDRALNREALLAIMQKHFATSTLIHHSAVSKMARAMRDLLEQQPSGDLPDAVEAVVRRAIASLHAYTSDVADNRLVGPLSMAESYADIVRLAGRRLPLPGEMFLAMEPKVLDWCRASATPMRIADFRAELARSRPTFQRELLGLHRAADKQHSLDNLKHMVMAMQAKNPRDDLALFFEAAAAAIESMSPTDIRKDSLAVLLRIDFEVNRIAGDALGDSTEFGLVSALLYEVAVAKSDTPRGRRLRDHLNLDRFLDFSDKELLALYEKFVVAMPKLRETWNRAPEPSYIDAFRKMIDQIHSRADVLRNPLFSAMASGIHGLMHAFVGGSIQFSEAMALEVASDLILMEEVLEATSIEREASAWRVQAATDRLGSLTRGEPPRPIEGGISDRQRNEVVATACQPLTEEIAGLEQMLVEAITGDSADAGAIRKSMRRIAGVFFALNLQDAILIMHKISGMADMLLVMEPEEKQHLADMVAFVGSYVRALLDHDVDEAAAILDKGIELFVPDEHARRQAQRVSDRKQDEATQVDSAEMDEMLDIYLDEAAEVIETIRGWRAKIGNDHDMAYAAREIRRGFHTLKGSGRMVGLKHLGEVAWDVERTMNRYIDAGPVITDSLLALIDAGIALIADRIPVLAEKRSAHVDGADVHAAAEALMATPIEKGFPAAVMATSPAPVQAADAGLALAPVASEAATPVAIDDAFPDLALDDPELPAVSIKVEPVAAPSEAADAVAPVDALPELLRFDDPATGLPAAIAHPVPEVEHFRVMPDPVPGDITIEDVLRVLGNDAGHEDASNSLPEPEASVEEVMTAPDVVLRGTDVPDVTAERWLFDLYVNDVSKLVMVLDAELAFFVQTGIPSAEFMRACHTIASNSAGIGISAIHDVARALENLISPNVGRSQPFSHENADLVSAAVKFVVKGVGQVLDNLTMPPARPDIVARLESEALSLETESISTTDDAGAQNINVDLGIGGDIDDLPAASEPVDAADLLPPLDEDIAPEASPVPANAPVDAADLLPPVDNAPLPAISRTSEPDDIDEEVLPVFLEEAGEIMEAIPDLMRRWVDGNDLAAAREIRRASHTMKGSARMAGAMRFGTLMHDLESALELVVENPSATTLADKRRVEEGYDAAAEMLSGYRGDSIAAPATDDAGASVVIAAAPVARKTVRVPAARLDAMQRLSAEMSLRTIRMEGSLGNADSASSDARANIVRMTTLMNEMALQAELRMQSGHAAMERWDSLEMDRFTRVQELARMVSECAHDLQISVDSLDGSLMGLKDMLDDQANAMDNVQHEITQSRLVPFENLDGRLLRIVRGACRMTGKRAVLEFGKVIDLDGALLERLAAPIEHIVRNAVAHGIELPGVRKAAGKSEAGLIRLDITSTGPEVTLTISDDGAGIDVARVVAKARAAGILGKDAMVNDDHARNLIFHPGFSTAEDVSELAGRGVGLDVVKTAIEELGGTVFVRSTPGKGTDFIISAPVDSTMIQGVIVSVQGYRYVIPTVLIKTITSVDRDSVKAAEVSQKLLLPSGKGMREHPFAPLNRLLGLPDSTVHADVRRNSAIIVLADDEGQPGFSLYVDKTEPFRKFAVRSVGVARVGVIGCTVDEFGNVAPIINPQALLRDPAHRSAQVITAASVEPSVAKQGLRIMVVDDSVTVRKMTIALLRKNDITGYPAKDGQDAWEQLREDVPDLILLDIEMPRMNGFELAELIRSSSNSALRRVPIIMISSRSVEKHMKHAFEIGVNRYLGKPYDAQQLLQAVQELVSAPDSVSSPDDHILASES